MKTDLLNYCCNATEREDFVGIRFDFDDYNKAQHIKITFPYGYHYSTDSDIFCLINVLSDYTNELQKLGLSLTNDEQQNFTIYSYMVVIQNFLVNGYYAEYEHTYKSQTHGKVNWARTIKKEIPIIQNNGVIYTNLQTRIHYSNDKHLMTEISKHCVYESILKFGWFYGLNMPNKPDSLLNKLLFIKTLQDKLNKSNKDTDRHLFYAMINILKNIENCNNKYFQFGTRRFEKVWEFLIDKKFGTEHGSQKIKYFPRATYLIDDKHTETNHLLPDTIMINHESNNIYVIDAKYYRYGITNNPKHLPNMSSIAKQITYAQYIDHKFKFNQVKNLFILPFNATQKKLPTYYCIGKATANWINECSYRYIYIIFIDTKHLMQSISGHSKKLLNVIENYP